MANTAGLFLLDGEPCLPRPLARWLGGSRRTMVNEGSDDLGSAEYNEFSNGSNTPEAEICDEVDINKFDADLDMSVQPFDASSQELKQVIDSSQLHMNTAAPPRPESTDNDECRWFKELNTMVRPENHEKWVANTMSNLSTAKALAKEAKNVLKSFEADPGYTVKRHDCRVDTHMKLKVGAVTDLTRALEDRVESVEDTIRQVGECLFQLQRAQRAKWAPLNVCERRLEIRDQRPLQELVRDHLGEALEHERQTLIEARHELADQIEATKETLSVMDAIKNELLVDLQHLRQAHRHDRAVANAEALGAGTDRLVLPGLTQRDVRLSQVPVPKTDEVRVILDKALKTEENAMRLCNACDAAMLNTKRECQKASAQSVASMSRRIAETAELKKRLEEQVAETDATVTQAERQLQRTKKELHHNRTLLSRHITMIEQQSKLSGMHNMVGSDLEMQMQHLKKVVDANTNKVNETKRLVENLLESKRQMNDDLRCKNQALKIDDSCMKVTPRKAIELDRSDPRGGRCLSSRRRGNNSARGSPQGAIGGWSQCDALAERLA